jgi:hypothetical protein
MNSLFIFLLSLVILFIWFETDAVVEYCLKLKIPLYKAKQYWDFKKTNNVSYPDYLAFNDNGFLTRLLSCHYCLAVIINLIIYGVYSYWEGFNLIILSFNFLMTWILYPKLIRHAKN